jgi:hypothetical protein
MDRRRALLCGILGGARNGVETSLLPCVRHA